MFPSIPTLTWITNPTRKDNGAACGDAIRLARRHKGWQSVFPDDIQVIRTRIRFCSWNKSQRSSYRRHSRTCAEIIVFLQEIKEKKRTFSWLMLLNGMKQNLITFKNPRWFIKPTKQLLSGKGILTNTPEKNHLDNTDRCTSTLLSSIPTIVETFRHISAFPRRRFALLSLSPTALGILLKIYDVRSVWIRKFLCSRMRYSTVHINTKRSVTSHSTIFERFPCALL